MISTHAQNNQTSEDIKQKILSDPVLSQLLTNYSAIEEEELIKKYTLLVSSDKYRKLQAKIARDST